MGKQFEAVVCGGSAGGVEALFCILKTLPQNFKLPIFIVIHLSEGNNETLVNLLQNVSQLKIKHPSINERIAEGVIYLASPSYHMLIEEDFTLSFSGEKKVCYCRPSIDLLFETAADAYKHRLIAVLLSGGNSDGSNGLKRIKAKGGVAIIQNPKTAKFEYMPAAALKATTADYILDVEKIAQQLILLSEAEQ